MENNILISDFEKSINLIYKYYKEFYDCQGEYDFIKDFLNIKFPNYIFGYDIKNDYFIYITHI